MKIIETKIYTFDELNDAAKEKARDWWRDGSDYAWGDDAIKSIEELAKHFGGKMKDWSIDWANSSYSSARFEMPEMESELILNLLGQLGTYNPETLKGNGDCKLTGYCADEDAIDGFRKAFHAGERDLEKLMQAAFDTWLESAQSDYEYQNSDEQVGETILANEYTFTETGKREG